MMRSEDTGAVQVQHPGSAAWESIDHSDATPLAKGSRLRTQPTVLCELQTSDKGKIRLNEAGEVVLHDTTEIELVKGQIWCLAPEDREIEIDFALRQKTTPTTDFLQPVIRGFALLSVGTLFDGSPGNIAGVVRPD